MHPCLYGEVSWARYMSHYMSQAKLSASKRPDDTVAIYG